jgi:hypothetical protein
MGQRFCYTANEFNREGGTVRKYQVSLGSSINPKFINQSFGFSDWWIDPDVLLERGEIEENLPSAESGHAIADARFRIGDPLLYNGLYRFQTLSRFRRGCMENVLVILDR